jgi:hypothetical protein
VKWIHERPSSAIVVAAGGGRVLAFLGDKTPGDRSAADVVQPAPARVKGSPGAGATARAPVENRPVVSRLPAGKAVSTLEVAALIPRDKLIPAAGDDPALVICSPR